MKMLKPKKLKKGDVIGLCAPASPPSSEEKLNRGISYLEHIGFRVEVGKNVLRRRGYLAGSDAERAGDFNSLFANPSVKAIFTVRGGYGSHRILPLINYSHVSRNPKIVVGYSDITALHMALLAKTGLVTFSGPMVSVEMSDGLDPAVEETFWHCLTAAEPPEPVKSSSHGSEKLGRKGIQKGRLVGGNLSLMTSLLDTPYFPVLKNLILLIEEIDESPYRVDRMLQHLKLGTGFANIGGVCLGDFTTCVKEKGKPSLQMGDIFKDVFRRFHGPVISDIPYGHIKKSVPFPIGTRVILNGNKNRIEFLESGVI